MMRRRQPRAGFTLIEMLLVVVAIALVIATVILWRKVEKLDENGRELTAWIGHADGPEPNAADGLTTYLIGLADKIHDHVNTIEPGNTRAHCAPPTCGPDHHLDPPPPPVW